MRLHSVSVTVELDRPQDAVDGMPLLAMDYPDVTLTGAHNTHSFRFMVYARSPQEATVVAYQAVLRAVAAETDALRSAVTDTLTALVVTG